MGLQILVIAVDASLATEVCGLLATSRPQVVSLRHVTAAGELLLALHIDAIFVEDAYEGRAAIDALEIARALQPDAHRFLVTRGSRKEDELQAAQPCALLTRAWLAVTQSGLRPPWAERHVLML